MGRNFQGLFFQLVFLFQAEDIPVLQQLILLVLESESGNVFLDVVGNNFPGASGSSGTLFISNTNGVFYSHSISNTFRDRNGYVDFEKILGLDGVAMINIVSNEKEALLGDLPKRQTMITYTNGATWFPLAAPSDLKNSCESSDQCWLNLQSFTSRKKVKNEMSDPGAIGVLIGVGNVGSFLKSYEEGDTFLTRNGGVNWTLARKGPHLFEFGDHGGVLVLVHARDYVSYVW